MPVKVLYSTATQAEAEALKKVKGIVSNPSGFRLGNLDISLLITGIGSLPSAWNLMKWIALHGKPGIAINAGIAGSFSDGLKAGDVVMPSSDCFADLGVEDGTRFMTLAEAGLSDPNDYPFVNGILPADGFYISKFGRMLKPVPAITCNAATGSEETRQKLVTKFNPAVETMEGASFFYICIRERIPFFGIRAISNRIEPRNKDNWNIQLALDNLSARLSEVLTKLD